MGKGIVTAVVDDVAKKGFERASAAFGNRWSQAKLVEDIGLQLSKELDKLETAGNQGSFRMEIRLVQDKEGGINFTPKADRDKSR